MKKSLVSIVMGSDSDLHVMKESGRVLKEFGVSHEFRVLSAHRSPKIVSEFAQRAREKGICVIIAGAGGAAHLAGVIAAQTTLPVIGVPIDSSSLHGIDALFSTVQMPSGIPVATLAIGKAGAANAGLLAVEILSLRDSRLGEKLSLFKTKLVRSVRAKDKKLRSLLRKKG